MKIQYNGSSKILKRLVELVNRSQNIALRQDSTDNNTLYWTGLDGVEITVNIPSGAVEVDAKLSETSTNPVENQAITKELAKKADKSDVPTVGNGVLSMQRNSRNVGTFSANSEKDTAINIPVPEKISELENDAGYGTYTKPTTGIPKSDLASGVQASLDKADTALQKHQDISGKLDKTGDASNTTVTFAAASAKENVKTGEKLSVIVGKIAKWFADLKAVAFTGSYNDLSNKPTIPDISGKQDKSTAVTHTANTAVGSATKPVYVAADGKATAITHSINADVPANAKFTDTTYSDATQTAHGLMTAADKAKLDGIDLSKYAALSHTHTDLDTVGSVGYYGSNSPNAAGWYKIYTGTITGYENNAATLLIEDGYNGNNVGFFHFKLRCNNGKIIVVQAFDWLIRRGFAADSIGVVTGNNEYSIYLYCDSVQWGRVKVRVLESQRTQHNLTMLLTSNTVKESIEPSFTRRSSDMGIVAEAQSLTDSGWLTPTTTDTSSSTLRYRKQGKIVCVSGNIKVSASTAAITPCTLPEGYRPPQKIKITQAVDSSSQDTYIVTIGTNGDVTYSGKKQGFFTTGSSYYMHVTYFID